MLTSPTLAPADDVEPVCNMTTVATSLAWWLRNEVPGIVGDTTDAAGSVEHGLSIPTEKYKAIPTLPPPFLPESLLTPLSPLDIILNEVIETARRVRRCKGPPKGNAAAARS